MFSVDNFYHVLYKNLLKPLNISYHYAYPFGSTTFTRECVNENEFADGKLKIFFWDQEPFDLVEYAEAIHKIDSSHKNFFRDGTILAYSDISKATTPFQLQWYYFFHGFAALDWFRDAQYIPVLNNNFTKVFITLNRLVSQERSYRLSFVANLVDQNLFEHGLVSCSIRDANGSWQDEIANNHSCLTRTQKNLIAQVFPKFLNKLVLDHPNVPGHASASFGNNEINLFQSAFLHVVTETVFYKRKLHLTEKIFRPIVVGRPFVLMGAAGNLEYLKRYGFETFGSWWNEDYDQETDSELRQNKVVKIINDLSKLDMSDLKDMYNEMLPVIKHNYNHFYTDFKTIIVDELINNFVDAVELYNSQNHGHYYDLSKLDIPTIKKRLTQ
jgi:hypothetical protein